MRTDWYEQGRAGQGRAGQDAGQIVAGQEGPVAPVGGGVAELFLPLTKPGQAPVSAM